MRSLLLSFFSAAWASSASWLLKKNSITNPNLSVNGYLLFFYLFSFLSSLLIYPEVWQSSLNYTMLIIGGCVGIANATLMILTTEALKRGPSGTTFAFQNAGAVFPSIVLFSVFGTEFGYTCTYPQIAGIVLVVLGLFLGARGTSGGKSFSFNWLKYALACLGTQAIALTLIQGRCVFFQVDKLYHPLSLFASSTSDDIWFMPGQFGTAALLQLVLFLLEKRPLKGSEILFGTTAGIFNCISTCLLLLATKWAVGFETAMLLPCFAVSVIILCNIWATLFYKEKFNFVANAVCSVGILIGL